jgi:hypothetical protein
VSVKRVLLAAPRGYCAGVDRAVDIVERALRLYGAPVYVRKQIVHNIHVVRDLQARGAIFVQEETEVPKGATVGFSDYILCLVNLSDEGDGALGEAYVPPEHEPDLVHVGPGKLAGLKRELGDKPRILMVMDTWHLNVDARADAATGIRRPRFSAAAHRLRRVESSG